MFGSPLNFPEGRRLDNIDYVNMGARNVWFVRDTIQLLTSFEMEKYGYFERLDYKSCYSRIFNRYRTYIYNVIADRSIQYNDGLSDESRELNKLEGVFAFDIHNAFFYKNDILNNIVSSNNINIDIELLGKYLSGQEAPIINKFTKETTVDTEGHEFQNISNEVTANICDSATAASSEVKFINTNQYQFEKTAQSWNIKFGDIELIGVKELAGMDYIATLLKNPGVPIGVIQIQAMLNPVGINTSGNKQSGEFEDQDEPSTAMNGYYARSSKSTSLENLRKSLLKLSQERNKLDPDCDHYELESIDNEYAKIEAAIDNILYSKNDDPEIKKNRDKVAKAIRKAIANIRGLKAKNGLATKPLCDFLTQYIKTGSECIYNPPTINPPEWTF